VRTAIDLVFREPQWGTLGAIAWWAFDIGVLWACFHAFGDETPTIAVIVMAYYVGQIANVLPLPGGIGGVEGGMIGAFIAFDVPGGLAVVSVLAYRAFAFWLPTIPGAIAYLQLRRTVAHWKLERAEARATSGVTPSGGTIQSKV
jgi:putative heme transporter